MNKCILVVEDNHLNMRLVVDLLKYNGFEVLEACNGEQALEYLNNRMPDLVLLDIQLPGISGFEVLKHIRSDLHTVNLKVIALTAQATTDDMNILKEKKFDGLIFKPIDTIDFIKKVKNTLDYSKEQIYRR